MGEDSEIGGGSMIVAPDGKILLNMKSRVGMETLEADFTKKFYKPAGFGNPPSSHFDYCEKGRRPYKYRPAGPFLVRNDEKTAYPRSSSVDGFYGAAPKSSLYSIACAVASGCDETLLTVYSTRDGKAVLAPDEALENISDGHGKIREYTLSELSRFDFGKGFGEEFAHLSIATLESVFQKYTCHTLFALLLKTPDKALIEEIARLVFLYDCAKYTLLLVEDEKTLALLKETAPSLPRALYTRALSEKTLCAAEEYGCVRIAAVLDRWSERSIKEAHKRGLYVEALLRDASDSEEKAQKALSLGVDVVASERCRTVAHAVKNTKHLIGGNTVL